MIVVPNLNNLSSLAIANIAIVSIILLVLCLWLVSSLKQARLKKALAKQLDESLFTPQFRCVLFSAGSHACKSALAFQTKPILINDAPGLPLQNCNAEKCACTLLKYDDRRTGTDRRDLEVLDKRKKSVYANKRRLKDRRRATIKEFLLPRYRSLSW